MQSPTFAKVMMTTDLSDASWAALPVAADLAKRYGAELCVCSVVEEPSHYTALGEHHAVDSRYDHWMKDAAVKARDRITSKLVEEDLKAEVVVVRSLDPATTALEQAEALGVDLLVLATHGRTGMSHFLLGSVAEKIVRRSPVPVVTVRAAELPKP